MDKLISREVLQQRKRRLIYVIIAGVILFFCTIVIFRIIIKPSVSKSQIAVFIADVGPVENTITAAGEILPEFEQVITSPINSSIQSVLIQAGTSVKPEQAILILDKASSQAEFEKQKFQLESKRNTIHKLGLDLNKILYDLKSSNEIKQLKINSLEATLEDYKRLFRAGGATKEDVAKAELELKVARLEKKQLENEIRSKVETMKSEMRESELDASIQKKDLSELGRKLHQANILTTRSGVLTWVNGNIGASVREGEVLARIADLRTFKVAATLSDSYLDQLRRGMPAIVRINDNLLRGSVASISPSVQNGLISFEIQLEEKNHKLLRPNLKVDVFLVTELQDHVVRVANGPAFKGAGPQDIFIVKDGKAVRRTVHVGMSNFDYVELKDNIQRGEAVITSDMSDFKNTKEINITD